MLLQVGAAPGETVSAGATIAEVVSRSPLRVKVAVPSGEVATVDLTAPARVEPLAGTSPRAHVGRPLLIAPPTASAPGCVDAWFEVANEDGGLVPGERVALVLARREDEESLVVPWGAVLQDSLGGTWVYEAAGTGRYVRRRVLVRRVAGELAVLARESAVGEGVRVVTAGAAELFGTEFGVGR